MKESDYTRLSNDEYDDAQAVQQSELLPIYEAMSFSGDIQPLDDIVEPEEIDVNFDAKRNENRGTEKKSGIKKKKISAHSDFNIKALIACIAVAVIVAGGITGAYFGIKRADVNSAPVSMVYKTTDKNTVIKLSDGTDYNIGEAREISVSTDGMYVWFTRNTSSATGKYDLRMVDVASKKSLNKQGRFIEKGIDDGWKTTKDGQFACYGITRSNITSCYMYSVDAQKADSIADSVEEYFTPSVGNTVYFTRRSGSIYSLHRAKYGDDSENVASGINHVKYVGDNDDYEIIYTQPTGNGTNVNIFSVKGTEKPASICEDVSEVYLDDYVYDGNLYYFKKNESNVNWQDFITDNYYENDMKIEKPVENDYMVEKGFIFKRRVLDTASYNAAMSRYELKAARDEIRNELNNLELGLTVKDEYTCFSYSGGASRRLASGVTLENIIEFSKDGDPKLIYRKNVIGVGSAINMDDLVDIAQRSNVQKAMDYVRNTVQGSYELSDSCFYSWFNGSRVLEYEVKDYEPDKTGFIFSNGGELYAVCNSELYFSKADNNEMSAKRLIDSNVSDCSAASDMIYYEKLDSSGMKNLCKYTPENGREEVCKNIYSYFAVGDNFVIVLTRQSDSDELVSVGIYDGKGYATIDSDLSLNNFIYSGKSFAYIKNFKSGSGELFGYSLEKGAVKCGDGVTQIMYIG